MAWSIFAVFDIFPTAYHLAVLPCMRYGCEGIRIRHDPKKFFSYRMYVDNFSAMADGVGES